MPFNYGILNSLRPERPVIVAEIGTSHGGNLQRGLELIDAAAEAGADVAKIQVIFADEILPPQAGIVPLPGGPTPLFEVFAKLERPVPFYRALMERAENRGLGFLASPFGEQSIALLEDLAVRAWKVASPELNHEPLLQRLAATSLPIILSTGVSRRNDIARALKVIRHSSPLPHHSIILLHCLTHYPAPEHECNLLAIPSLRRNFGLPVGISDHSTNPILIPAIAAALGAFMVEKHITLQQDSDGLDDKLALTPKAFAQMTQAVSAFAGFHREEAFSGDEQNIAEQARETLDLPIEELSREFGRERVEACLGSGEIGLADCEKAHYGRTNRSIHARAGMKCGTIITEGNTAILRTEKVLQPGIAPKDRNKVYGRRLIRDIAAGEGISWEDLEP